MRTTLLLLLVTTACATTETTSQADSFELTGIPVSEASLRDVVRDMQDAAHSHVDHVGTVAIVAKPFPCVITKGRKCGGDCPNIPTQN